jgi:spermidine/putrescine transport system substrate-binding protein
MTDRIIETGELPVTRRRFLQGTALAGVGAFLAACTTGGSSETTPPASAAASSAPSAGASSGAQTPTGPLQFANWDAYIDLGEDETTSPTIESFKQQYGVDVNYANAKIEDNETFVATIRPQLESGVPTGWDLIVLTDWMAAKLIGLGWMEEIDPAVVPTAIANLRDQLKDRPWDPDQKHHYPWQSGATGIGYNVKSTGRDLTKVADLFDPAFKGKVTLLTDVRDTFPLVFLSIGGTNPEEMTVADAQQVKDYLQPFVDDGQIRAFTGNEYLQDFGSGDTWAALVYSGDLASSGGEDDRFTYPEEGAMFWTDNMLIPKGAQNKYTAELMIDWVYDVERATNIADYVYYISPVKGVDEAIKALDPDAADNPLLFPPPDVVARMHPAPVWNDEDEKAINEMFAELTGV